MAEPEEKCDCCSGGIVNPKTGHCDMCERPVEEKKQGPKLMKRPMNGHGNRYQRRRCG